MATITKEEAEHVALLAKLHFADAEMAGFSDTLGKIIDMFEQLDEVDTADVPFTMNVADNLNRMREDVAVAGWDRAALLRAVPETEAGFIKVPAILDDGGDA